MEEDGIRQEDGERKRKKMKRGKTYMQTAVKSGGSSTEERTASRMAQGKRMQ